MEIQVQHHLICPYCKGKLAWSHVVQDSTRILDASIECLNCHSEYFVRDRIGNFLRPDATRDDLWQQVHSNLTGYFATHPEVEAEFTKVEPQSLAAADRFLWSMVLDDRRDFGSAKTLAESALAEIYTPDLLTATNNALTYIATQIAEQNTQGDVVVDIASGRGYLLEKLLEKDLHIIGSDFSPHVIRRDRGYFDFHLPKHARKLSTLSFDAGLLPFADESLPWLTTHVGLLNMSDPISVLEDLRRVTSGAFYASFQFYAPDDSEQLNSVKKPVLRKMYQRETTLAMFAATGWDAEVVFSEQTRIAPTPTSEILGIGIDGMPIKETTIEVAVVRATPRQ